MNDHGSMTPPRPVYRVLWALHRGLWRLSGGRIGARRPGTGVGTLFLASTGRTSGATRRNGLFYIKDDDRFVVVASNAGADVDPAWWRNLQATPDAAVELGGRTVLVRARLADAAELLQLWPRLVEANPAYATYQAEMTREIPVVILEPR
jgi:deazaflavin-dependent oxidoreductase (nitroreductase family)